MLVGSIDWVDRRGMIKNVFQRTSAILDLPIANVDHMLLLFSMDQPKPEPFTLTRFLVEAKSTGNPLILAMNKSEIVNEETMVIWKSRLRSWGYEPLFFSVESKYGLDSLAFILRDQTTVIVDPSGVGKPSLINALRNKQRGSATGEDNWFDTEKIRVTLYVQKVVLQFMDAGGRPDNILSEEARNAGFSIPPNEFAAIIRSHDIKALKSYGGVQGAERKLSVSLNNGVSERDLLIRENVFGANRFVEK